MYKAMYNLTTLAGNRALLNKLINASLSEKQNDLSKPTTSSFQENYNKDLFSLQMTFAEKYAQMKDAKERNEKLQQSVESMQKFLCNDSDQCVNVFTYTYIGDIDVELGGSHTDTSCIS